MAQLVASMSGVVSRSWVRISLEAKHLQHLSAQLILYTPLKNICTAIDISDSYQLNESISNVRVVG